MSSKMDYALARGWLFMVQLSLYHCKGILSLPMPGHSIANQFEGEELALVIYGAGSSRLPACVWGCGSGQFIFLPPTHSVTSCLCSPGQAGFVSEVAFYKGWQAGAVGAFWLAKPQALELGSWGSQCVDKERRFPGLECTECFQPTFLFPCGRLTPLPEHEPTQGMDRFKSSRLFIVRTLKHV